jgi:hypothetical protein
MLDFTASAEIAHFRPIYQFGLNCCKPKKYRKGKKIAVVTLVIVLFHQVLIGLSSFLCGSKFSPIFQVCEIWAPRDTVVRALVTSLLEKKIKIGIVKQRWLRPPRKPSDGL